MAGKNDEVTYKDTSILTESIFFNILVSNSIEQFRNNKQ